MILIETIKLIAEIFHTTSTGVLKLTSALAIHGRGVVLRAINLIMTGIEG